MPAREGLDDEHRRTTVAADEDRLNDGGGLIRLRLSRFGYDLQQLARSRQIVSASGIGDQPIVTDAVKAGGQNV